jgi:hypothetical protein
VSDRGEELIASLERRGAEQFERAGRLTERMRGLTASAEAGDRAVRVTVDSAGGLAGLEFGTAAGDYLLEELAALVLKVSREAQAGLVRSVEAAAAEIYGADSPAGAVIAEAYGRQFEGER